jgi:hypothetical protein
MGFQGVAVASKFRKCCVVDAQVNASGAHRLWKENGQNDEEKKRHTNKSFSAWVANDFKISSGFDELLDFCEFCFVFGVLRTKEGFERQ